MSFLGIYDQDIHAKTIVSLWDQLSAERNTYINRGVDMRKYLTAPDTSYTEVGTNTPWKNRTVIPKLTQIYDNLTAQYMQSIMPNNDWVIFEGYQKEDVDREALVEQYIRFKLEESNFRDTLRKLISDYVAYGMVCVGVEHVHDRVKTRTNGEEITKYYGPKGFRVSPYDYVIEPRAASYEESVFIRKYLVPLNKILKNNDTNSIIKYNEDAITKMKDVRAHVYGDEEYLKETGLYVDGFSGPQEYFKSNMVEVMEFWGDIYNWETGELLENHTIAIVDRAFVLYDMPNPMWNGKRPYSITGWRERPDNLYSQSPLEQLVGMQYRIDHLENLKADIINLTAHPVVVITGDPVEEFTWEPGKIYNAGMEGRVDILRPDTSALQLDNEKAFYMAMMEEMAGAPKESAGFRTPGEKTAFEVNVLQQGANKMFLEKSKHFEQFLEEYLENFYTMMAMNFNASDILRIFDKDTEAIDIVRVGREDVIREGKIKLTGSKQYERRARRLQELRDALGIMASTQQTAMHIDGYAIDKYIEKELDLEREEIVKEFKAITDNVDAQAAATMHQQRAQEIMGAAAPEGGLPRGTEQIPAPAL